MADFPCPIASTSSLILRNPSNTTNIRPGALSYIVALTRVTRTGPNFMRRFRMRTEEALEYFERRYLMDAKLIFTVIEDRDMFESASTSTVREHFKRWVMDAPRSEQGRGAGRSPRYKYCIHVDPTSVHSVLQDAPAEGRHNSIEGFVNLIAKGWKLDSDNWDEWDELDPSSNEPNEPIESVQLWDVS